MLGFLKNMFGSNTEEMKELISKGAAIIDVRTPGEFAGGHANGAVNVPLNTIGSNIAKIKKHKSGVVLCCASGMRSAQAKGVLTGKGLENIHDAGAWTNLR